MICSVALLASIYIFIDKDISSIYFSIDKDGVAAEKKHALATNMKRVKNVSYPQGNSEVGLIGGGDNIQNINISYSYNTTNRIDRGSLVNYTNANHISNANNTLVDKIATIDSTNLTDSCESLQMYLQGKNQRAGFGHSFMSFNHLQSLAFDNQLSIRAHFGTTGHGVDYQKSENYFFGESLMTPFADGTDPSICVTTSSSPEALSRDMGRLREELEKNPDVPNVQSSAWGMLHCLQKKVWDLT